MIPADALISKFQSAHSEGWGYIFGKYGQLWTQARQTAIEKTTADKYAKSRKYGSKWIGHHVADCSGLFRWAYLQYGIELQHSSNAIWRSHCSKRGKLVKGHRADGIKIKPATAVFLNRKGNRHHIGLYVGGDTVIEAKGVLYGVVTSSLSDWDEWGELKAIDYSAYPDEKDEGAPIMYPTLKKGDKGEDVKRLQTILRTLGYDLEADGVYGSKTKGVVEFFQMCNKLAEDGVCGPKTWARLMEIYNESTRAQPDDDLGDLSIPGEDDPEDTVDVSREQLQIYYDQLMEITYYIGRLINR